MTFNQGHSIYDDAIRLGTDDRLPIRLRLYFTRK